VLHEFAGKVAALPAEAVPCDSTAKAPAAAAAPAVAEGLLLLLLAPNPNGM
jgi:hypothetical protein